MYELKSPLVEPYFYVIGMILAAFLFIAIKHIVNNSPFVRNLIQRKVTKDIYQKIFHGSREALMTLDGRTGQFTYANETTLNLFGFKDLDEFCKTTPWELSPKFQADGVESQLKALQVVRKAFDEGHNFFHWIHQRLDGKLIHCSVHLTHVVNGSDDFLIANVRDITEELRIKEDYQAEKKVFSHRERLADIGELASGVAHEINNPLMILRGYSNNLERRVSENSEVISSEELRKFLTRVEYATDRIHKIVRGLGNFSRIDDGDHKAFDVMEAVTESCNMIKGIYRSDGIHIELLPTPKVKGLETFGNRHEFQQVLMNLISNAKDAVRDQDEKRITIKASLYADGQNLILDISDTGHGFSEGVREKIFDPFFTTKPVGKGTGIGLAKVKSILTEMGAHIHVDSTPGKGTTFSLKIPCYLDDTDGLSES